MTIPEFDAFRGGGQELRAVRWNAAADEQDTRTDRVEHQGQSQARDGQAGLPDYQCGMMVQALANSAGRDKFRPDVVVRCDPPTNNTFIIDPIVVIAVVAVDDRPRPRSEAGILQEPANRPARRAGLHGPDAGRTPFQDRERLRNKGAADAGEHPRSGRCGVQHGPGGHLFRRPF